MSNKTSTPQAGRSNAVAIVTMFFLFAMISFVTNLAAPIGTIWKGHYEWAGMIGNFMNFLAYLFMGIPAGTMLVKFGYKKTALAALAVGAAGILIQYLSSVVGADTATFSVGGQPVMLNYLVYLLGAFVCGFCVCMLNTVVNPMLNLLGGGGRKGNQLLQAGGSLNSLAGTLTPFFVGMLVGTVTATTSIADVSVLLWIAFAVFVASFIIIGFVSIPEPQNNTAGRKRKFSHSPWSFRHTVLGVIGIFFYVGIEVGIPGVLIFYLSDPALGLENGVALAGGIAAVYWLLMLVGRLSSSAISGFVTSKVQLMVTSSVAIVLVLLAIFISSDVRISMPSYSVEEGFSMAQVPIKALFLVLCGLCTSVMWGSIFNLAVEGLGKYTAQASGIFMMMVVGGGVMPYIQDWIGRTAGYVNSYWLVVAMLVYILFYSIAGSKNVNRDIPVGQDEAPDLRDL